MDMPCPVCLQVSGEHFRVVDGFDYYQCTACASIYIAPEILAGIDAGTSPRSYDADYWRVELESARDRSRSDALVRAGEAILYAQRKVTRFPSAAVNHSIRERAAVCGRGKNIPWGK